MKISERLITIASFIDDDAFVMDVGADHGLLELYLLDNKHLKGLIAVENKKGPFQILEKAVKHRGVTCSLSDGIETITDSVDTVVIAGMGGHLIIDILTKDKSKLNKVNKIVVDAHNDIEFVRREIVKLGYEISKEKIVHEGKFYFVISFIKGKTDYSQSEYEFGFNIKDDPNFVSYKEYELSKMESELQKAKSATKLDEVKIKSLSAKIERLKAYGNN